MEQTAPTEIWPLLPHLFAHHVSRKSFRLERYLQYIGERIAAAVYRGNGRLMIHAPPRHGKSTLISHWLPTWFLERFPDRRVILSAYGDEIATEWGRKVRNEFGVNREYLTTQLKEDSKAVGRWHTGSGGGMMAVGVGGALSGFGGHLLVCDDLIKNWQDAHSAKVKDHLYDWWNSTFYTRAEPGATIVVAMTRWTPDDLPSRIREEHPNEWEVINFPAIAEDNDALGREIGDPLCPSRFDRKALEKIRDDVGAQVWNALYQQRPDPFGIGRLFNRFSQLNVDDKVTLRADLPISISLDFNINPGNHGIVGQYDNRKDLFTITDEFHGPHMDIRTLIRHFCEWLKGKGWIPGVRMPFPDIHVYGDATGEAEWSGTAESCYDLVRHQLRMAGLPFKIRHLTKNPSLRESIDASNEAFRDVQEKLHVLVHPRCKILINDFQKMRSDENGLIDKKEDAIGHAGDCARYWISYMRPLYRFTQSSQSSGLVFGVPQT